MVNSLKKRVECWDAGFVNKGVKKGMCGRTWKDQCYPVNKNIGSILGKVIIQELDSHCGAAVEV